MVSRGRAAAYKQTHGRVCHCPGSPVAGRRYCVEEDTEKRDCPDQGEVSTLDAEVVGRTRYNNGITIVASNYVKSDSDSTVEIRDPYVVNGCQTTRSIWQVLDGKLNSDGSARSDALNEWREGVERGGVIAKIVKSGEANILGSVDISRHSGESRNPGTLWKADIVHIQGTLDSRFRRNDELGLAKSPYISNVNTA